jgi:hypothetical protein
MQQQPTAPASRARAAEQMACEDAWKVLNPDFRTPFASVEDAVSRCAPSCDIDLPLRSSCRRSPDFHAV